MSLPWCFCFPFSLQLRLCIFLVSRQTVPQILLLVLWLWSGSLNWNHYERIPFGVLCLRLHILCMYCINIFDCYGSDHTLLQFSSSLNMSLNFPLHICQHFFLFFFFCISFLRSLSGNISSFWQLFPLHVFLDSY